jgi:hypothetical protein
MLSLLLPLYIFSMTPYFSFFFSLCDALIHTSRYKLPVLSRACPIPLAALVAFRPWLVLKSRLYPQSRLVLLALLFFFPLPPPFAWVGVSSTKSSCISRKENSCYLLSQPCFNVHFVGGQCRRGLAREVDTVLALHQVDSK